MSDHEEARLLFEQQRELAAERDRLRVENGDLLVRYDRLRADYSDLCDHRHELRARVAELEAALRTYGVHDIECPADPATKSTDWRSLCNCGLHAALYPAQPRTEAGRDIRPFGHDDPATCEHRWESHSWEPANEYCPYCASTRPRPSTDGEPDGGT
jgi:hypothetical protein